MNPRGLRHSIADILSNPFDRIVDYLARRGVGIFTEPVHETITRRSFGAGSPQCGTRDPDCSFVLTGVRWNDDPPIRVDEGAARGTNCKVVETFRVTTQPVCWVQLFNDAKRRAAAGEKMDAAGGFALLHRAHFGDLQFVHSMASADGESPRETRRHILMWAEVIWRIGAGDFGLGKELRAIDVEGFDAFLGQSGWRVQDLFTLGDVTLRNNIREIAFGSLLHTVQDSFAKSHVERRDPLANGKCPGTDGRTPGEILEFHAYSRQDGARHEQYDGLAVFEEQVQEDDPDVIDATRVLVELFSQGAAWQQAKPYLECVFQVDDRARNASGGEGFRQ